MRSILTVTTRISDLEKMGTVRKTFQVLNGPAVVSMLVVMFLSAQTSVARAEGPLTVSVSGSEASWVKVSGNTWSYNFCSNTRWKGEIQEKVKGKWTTLKNVKKTYGNKECASLTNGSKIYNAFSFSEKKIGKREYRLFAYKKTYSFTIVVEKAAPSPSPTPPSPTPRAPAPPVTFPYSSAIASKSSGLDAAVRSALITSLARGDTLCGPAMSNLAQTNFTTIQGIYQSGRMTEGSAIALLDNAWSQVRICR